MKYRLQHIFLTAPAPSAWLVFALCLALTACGLEEPVDTPSTSGGYIEFVARPTGFNNQTVATKSQANDFETAIHNCFFLLFDNETGNRIGSPKVLGANSLPSQLIKLDKGQYTSITSCFIANVPASFVNGIISLQSLNSAVLDFTYAAGASVGIPSLDLDDNAETASIPCIPMFGSEEINLLNTSTTVQISLKRLFAKVTVSLSMDLGFSTAEGIFLRDTKFTVLKYTIKNLPKKVKLTEPSATGYQSDWSSSAYTELEKGSIDFDLFDVNATGKSANSKKYEFDLYIPEYFLIPEGNNASKDEKLKPTLLGDTQRAVNVFLQGTYDPASGNKVDLNYSIYFGENEYDSFTLKRNYHYKNNIQIKGTRYSKDPDNEYLDYRVEVTTHDLNDMRGETSNCYLINEVGSYYFPAYKGVWQGGLSNLPDEYKCSTSTQLIVKAKSNNSIGITNLTYNKTTNEFAFDVTNVANGNVVLALVDDNNNVEWSWHFWFSSGFSIGNTDLLEVGTNTYGNNAVMMDRNLGAESSAITLLNQNQAIGAYYKYGYRDPYFADALNSNQYGYHGDGLTNYVDWANSDGKSRTDPCPPGYRVPSTAVWQNFTLTKSHDAVLGAFLLYRSGLTNIYYPYSGYVDEGGNLKSQSYDEPDNKDMSVSFIPTKQKDWTSFYSLTDPRVSHPIKDLKLDYNVLNINVVGYLHTHDPNNSNQKILKYYYEELGFEITNCSFTEGTWTTRKSWGVTYYTADYSKSETKTFSSEQEIKAYDSDLYDMLKDKIEDENSDKPWWDITGMTTLFSKKADCGVVDPEKNTYAYQVRCVSESSPVK